MKEPLDPRLEAALDKLLTPTLVPKLAQGEFTVAMIAKRYGIGRAQARRRIDDLVLGGKAVTVGERISGRSPATAWKLV